MLSTNSTKDIKRIGVKWVCKWPCTCAQSVYSTWHVAFPNSSSSQQFYLIKIPNLCPTQFGFFKSVLSFRAGDEMLIIRRTFHRKYQIFWFPCTSSDFTQILHLNLDTNGNVMTKLHFGGNHPNGDRCSMKCFLSVIHSTQTHDLTRALPSGYSPGAKLLNQN